MEIFSQAQWTNKRSATNRNTKRWLISKKCKKIYANTKEIYLKKQRKVL